MESIKLTNIECTDNRSMSGIEELAANIAAVGLIQPIALAATDAGRYQVVAGRRRFRAVQRLGWGALAEGQYVICTAEPELAAFCENFHRANLTLAEEVEQFNHLKTDKLTIKELAALLGKNAGVRRAPAEPDQPLRKVEGGAEASGGIFPVDTGEIGDHRQTARRDSEDT